MNNSTGAVYARLEAVGVQRSASTNNPDVVTTNARYVYLPAAATGLAYDADGRRNGVGHLDI